MTKTAFSMTELARRHAQAAIAEAAAHGHPSDSAARALLNAVIEIYRRGRSPDDIRRELEFVAAHLEPDDEFEFMRP